MPLNDHTRVREVYDLIGVLLIENESNKQTVQHEYQLNRTSKADKFYLRRDTLKKLFDFKKTHKHAQQTNVF